MRRMILWAGVLSCAAASEMNGQSLRQEPVNSCPVGSSGCGWSYFDYMLASTGVMAFDWFLSSEGSKRRTANRVVLRGVTTARGSRSSDLESVVPDEPRKAVWNTNRGEDLSSNESPRRASSNGDLALKNTMEAYWWDWLERMKGPQRPDFPQDTRPSDATAERSESRNDAKRPRLNRGTDDRRGGEDVSRGNEEGRESPNKPDVKKDQLEASLTPEPSTLLLIGSGLPLALAFVRRRRRQ